MKNLIDANARIYRGIPDSETSNPPFDVMTIILDVNLDALDAEPLYYRHVTQARAMTQPEKDQADIDRLPDYKTNKKKELEIELNQLINDQYPRQRRDNLVFLYVEGVDKSWTNRLASIHNWVDWIDQCLDELETRYDDVTNAVDIAAVDAVSIDTATLITADPVQGMLATHNIKN